MIELQVPTYKGQAQRGDFWTWSAKLEEEIQGLRSVGLEAGFGNEDYINLTGTARGLRRTVERLFCDGEITLETAHELAHELNVIDPRLSDPVTKTERIACVYELELLRALELESLCRLVEGELEGRNGEGRFELESIAVTTPAGYLGQPSGASRQLAPGERVLLVADLEAVIPAFDDPGLLSSIADTLWLSPGQDYRLVDQAVYADADLRLDARAGIGPAGRAFKGLV